MSEPKQVIVMRKDLNMRKGKMVAQGAHASMKVILDFMYKHTEVAHHSNDKFDRGDEINVWSLKLADWGKDEAIQAWLLGRFTKVCVSVDSEPELLEIHCKAKEAGLPCSLIQDAGLTEFAGVPTYTCVAIGPAYPEEIDKITGHLKLL